MAEPCLGCAWLKENGKPCGNPDCRIGDYQRKEEQRWKS